MKRSGSTFKTHREFTQRIESFGRVCKVFVAEHEGIIQGCMVSPSANILRQQLLCGLPGRSRFLGSMHLLHWEAIRQFREMGVKRFDFQGVRINPEKGSKQEGILNYKQGFGGRLVQGYLWKYRLRPLKSKAYSLAVRWLKGGDFVDQERHKLTDGRIVEAASAAPEPPPGARSVTPPESVGELPKALPSSLVGDWRLGR